MGDVTLSTFRLKMAQTYAVCPAVCSVPMQLWW